jgi:hypothetical protein
MADLTDEQLEGMSMWNRDVMLDERHRAVGALLVRMAVDEIRRHRADRAADEERVRSVVREAVLSTLHEMDGQCRADRDEQAARLIQSDAIATRAAKQLATAAPPADKVTSAILAFCDAVAAASRAHDQRGKGGQHVSFHGDFAGAHPGVLNRLEWWARHLRSVLP